MQPPPPDNPRTLLPRDPATSDVQEASDMAYDDTAEANCAKALAKFTQDYGYDRFTWRGALKSAGEPNERFTVEVRLFANNMASNEQDDALDLASRLAGYRSASEFGPIRHIICDEAAALIWKLVAENRQLVSERGARNDLIARETESAAQVRSSAKAMLAAFGGNIPVWLRDEAGALDRAIAQVEGR